MISACFDRVYAFAGAHRRKVAVCLLLLAGVSLIRVLSIPFNNDVASMLPDNPVIKRQLSFLRNSDMAGTMAVSVTLKNSGSLSLLLERSKIFAGELDALPMITKTMAGIEQVGIKAARGQLVSVLPVLMEKDTYELSGKRNSPEQIGNRLKQTYIMLTTPGSGFLQSTMRTDPLGWSDETMREISRMAGSMGYNVKLAGGRFVDAKGGHALIVAKTSVPVTDGKGARHLLDAFDKLAGKYPDLDFTVVCGHRHTVSNETVIRKDVRTAMICVAVAFALLMLSVFRTFEALLVFATPFAAIAVSVSIASLLYSELSLFMMGFAAVIAGISVDYGIHAYTAFKSGGHAKLKQTGRLVLIASLTTAGVFVSFYSSSVQDYGELATFSILSIFVCVALYLLVIPHFWTSRSGVPEYEIPAFASGRFSAILIIGAWIAVIVFSLASISGLEFTTDISSLDGSGRDVLEAENRFHDVWEGKKQPGVVVVESSDAARGWRTYARVSRETARSVESFTSLALVWPDLEQRRENLKNFRQYWTKERVQKMKSRLSREAAGYGFSAEAFRPFYELLNTGLEDADVPMPDLFVPFGERFVKSGKEGVTMLGYFDDTPGTLARVHAVADRYPDAYVVSREELSGSVSDQVFSDMKRVSLISGLWVPVLAALFMGNIRRTALALVPVVTAVPAVFAVLSLLHIKANVVVLITLIVILGLSIDYGVFLAGFKPGDDRGPAVKAVTFSMLTTVAGTIGLLFASHPAMFVVGVTMISGITTAWLSAMFCIPALEKAFS